MILIVRGSIGILRIPYFYAQKTPSTHQNRSKNKGASQSEGVLTGGIAYEIGLDRTYMGSVERGERNIAAINLIKIAKILKVEVGEIFPATRTLPLD